MMRFHVETRSRNKDYQFLGGSPGRWWSRYGSDTSFERPTLLVESSPEFGWRVLASGIPSKRKDRHSTQLRFTIVAQGDLGTEPAIVSVLISEWLDEAAALLAGRTEDSDRKTLSGALDQFFNEEKIEEWFNSDLRSSEIGENAQVLLIQALESLTGTSVDTPNAELEGWYGSIHSGRCRQAFLGATSDLLAGKIEGSACLLNLAEKPQDLGIRKEPYLILVFDIPEGQAPEPLELPSRYHWEAKKKERPPTGSSSSAPTQKDSSKPSQDEPVDRDSSDPDDLPGGDTGLDDDELAGKPPESDKDQSEHSLSKAESGLFRRAIQGRDYVRKVTEAGRGTFGGVFGVGRETLEDFLGVGRGTLDEVLGASKDTLEEVLGAGRQTLEILRKEVTAAAKDGVPQARELLETIETVMNKKKELSDAGKEDGSEQPETEEKENNDETEQEPV